MGGYRKHRKLLGKIPLEEWMNWKDKDGASLFDCALKQNDMRVLKILLAKSSKCFKIQDHLYYYFSPDVIKLLLSQGYMKSILRKNNFDYFTTDGLMDIYIMNGVKVTYTKIDNNRDEEVAIQRLKTRKRYMECKKRILILLALKRRRIHSMVYLDRFLLRVLAVEMYTDRYQYSLPNTYVPAVFDMYVQVYGKFRCISVAILFQSMLVFNIWFLYNHST
jgi:hypothetical protein